MEPRELLRAAFDAAVTAATPRPAWFEGLERPRGRTVVIGAGKAAASMARAFEDAFLPLPQSGRGVLTGLVVVPYGHAVPTRGIEVVEAGHPVPDAAGERAARRVLSLVESLTADDLVVALFSGGGSSLLAIPAPGMTLDEKRAVSRALLRSGATIAEINPVRKRLSAIKGGRLLAACGPARVATFVVSDVPGDDPATVASGPTMPDATPPGEALRVVERYEIELSSAARNRLSVPPVAVAGGEVRVVATARLALKAAAERARSEGVAAYVLSDRVQGEAREVARRHAALAQQVADVGRRCLLLSGGETTVTVCGAGRGGRNVEFAAALAGALGGHPRVHALAADTDGIDGNVPTAGAFVDPSTARRAGARLERALAENDAHTLFETLDDALVTGPTLTNVNDFRAILIGA